MSPFFGLFTLAAFLLASGLVALIHDWRKVSELQLRLDACVGQAALELQHSLEDIHEGNTEMRALRVAIAAAKIPAPQTVPPLMALLSAVFALQEARLLRWKARQASWMLQMGCRHMGDIPRPLPNQPWKTQIPDDDGPRPLEWTGSPKQIFHISAHHSPRAAAAEVRSQYGAINARWESRWTSTD